MIIGRPALRRAGGVLVLLVNLVIGAAIPSEVVASGASPGPRRDPAGAAYKQVDALVQSHRYLDAESLARKLLRQAERAGGASSPAAADALDALVWALFRAEKSTARETILLAERAVRIKTAYPGPDMLGVAFSLNLLGNVRHARGEFEMARQVARRVVAIREKILGPDDLDVAKALHNLATETARIGDYAAARPLYERVVRIFRSVGAREYPEQSFVLNNMALLLRSLGDYSGALPLFERTLEIQVRALGPGAGELAGTLGNLCDLQMKMNDYDGARRACERSLALWEKDPGPVTRATSMALWNLARVLSAAGDRAGARRLLERSLAIRGTLGLLDELEAAQIFATLGEIEAADGDRSHGRSAFEKAIGIESRRLPAGHPLLGDHRRALAGILWKLGDVRGAWENALSAESIVRESLRQVAAGLSEREAIQYERIRVSGLDLMLTILASGQAESAGPGALRRAFGEVVRSRAMVLDATAFRNRAIRSSADERVASLAEALRLSRSRLSHLLVAGPDAAPRGSYPDEVRRAREQTERAERELASLSSAFRKETAEARADLPEIAEALPSGGALVSYVRYNRLSPGLEASPLPTYAAFVLAPGGTDPALVSLGGAAGIDDLIGSWKEQVSRNPAAAGIPDAEAAYRGAARALRAAIWDPVAARMKAPRLVFIVPDGALHLVSFATLPVDDARYLIETGPLLHYLSAERELARAPAPRPRGNGLLAVGGADFDLKPPATPAPAAGGTPGNAGADASLARFGPLPASLAEVNEIGAFWPRRNEVRILTGAEASEAAVVKEAPGRRVVHLATHGFQLRESAPDAGGEPAAAGASLIVSGLALAGANNRTVAAAGEPTQDGILTGEEIASLDLSGVDWAVLSACQSGVGPALDGEGVLGLRRAFQIAGAGTLIMSLWPVEDDATRVWMRGLYRSGLSGRPAPIAVEEAGLAMIASQRGRGATTHPFYWGGFVAAGEWRTSPAERPGAATSAASRASIRQ